jgi:hypothetical protein
MVAPCVPRWVRSSAADILIELALARFKSFDRIGLIRKPPHFFGPILLGADIPKYSPAPPANKKILVYPDSIAQFHLIHKLNVLIARAERRGRWGR